MIDLIVPTIEGREESLERCLASFPDLNHIVVKGQPTCGLGWIEGMINRRLVVRPHGWWYGVLRLLACALASPTPLAN